jgi:hypothetical protein
MGKKEFIILIEFSSLENALLYIDVNNTRFSFSVAGETYSSDGDLIDVLDDFDIININDIYIDIYDNPLPGELYIENGFLKYYKENYEI